MSDESPLLKGAFRPLEILGKIMGAVQKRGGGDLDVEKILTDGGVLADKIAVLLTGKIDFKVPTTHVERYLRLPVFLGKLNLKEVIASARLFVKQEHQHFVDALSKQELLDSQVSKIGLFHFSFNKAMMTPNAELFMGAEDFEPSSLLKLLAVALRYGHLQKSFRIVSLQPLLILGEKLVPVLGMYSGEEGEVRSLEFLPYDSSMGWEENCHFIGQQKATVAVARS